MTNFPVYQTALFLHILGALGFFIALGVFYASVLGVRRAQTAGSITLWTGAAAGVSRILFPISFLVIVIAGLYMVATVWSERAEWAMVALVAFIVLAIGATFIQGRRMGALGQSAATQSESAPVAGALWTQAHDPVTWVSVNASAAFAIGIVYLMTLKPDALGSVIALLIALVVGLAFGFLTQGRPVAAPALAQE
jgi:hypothetical protein